MNELLKKSEAYERELIARLTLHLEDCARVMSMVSVEDFTHYRSAFQLAVDSFKNGKYFIAELSIRHPELAQKVIHELPRPDVTRICHDIVSCADARRVEDTLKTSLKTIDYENIHLSVSNIQKKLLNSVSSKGKEDGNIALALSEYKTLQTDYKARIGKDGIIGISTGFSQIDSAIDGIRPEHLWIIGGYTNMGKTSAALNLVANLAKQGKRVVIYSLEMSKTDIISRLLGIMTNDNGISILKGYANNEAKVQQAMQTLVDSNMSIFCGKNELSEIQMSMHEEELKQHVDLFVLDFIQIVTVKGAKSEYEMITNTALTLQQTAKKLKCPIMALSQISNDGARNTDQDVMTFKGSGSIASAADFAIEITRGGEDKEAWKEKIKNGQPVEMKWVIRKNRHGRVGYVDMMFDGKTGIFKIDEIEL